MENKLPHVLPKWYIFCAATMMFWYLAPALTYLLLDKD